VRVNLGLFQHDVNVIWDLAIHDLSIMDCVLPAKPVAISATGISHVPGQPENVAYITLFFASTQIAHVHVNWLTPVKVRHTLIGGSEKMILYDDLEPSEKLKVYDKGISVTHGPEDVYKMLVSYRSGDMWAPRLDNTEALQTEALHFIKTHKEETKALIAKNLKTNDPEGLERAYRAYNAAFPEVPYPNAEGVKTLLDDIAPRTPKAATADPKSFVDMSLVQELEASGFIKQLYKR